MDGTFKIKIEMGNDAMQTPRELAQALREVAAEIEGIDLRETKSRRISDDNGNTVGKWSFDGEDEDEDDSY